MTTDSGGSVSPGGNAFAPETALPVRMEEQRRGASRHFVDSEDLPRLLSHVDAALAAQRRGAEPRRPVALRPERAPAARTGRLALGALALGLCVASALGALSLSEDLSALVAVLLAGLVAVLAMPGGGLPGGPA